VLARREFGSWESQGWLTSKDVKREVPKYLAPSHSQRSHGERIEEGASIPKLHLEIGSWENRDVSYQDS
jgi:hypothetical protein